eukprot:498205-Rhodomonas_salina.1
MALHSLARGFQDARRVHVFRIYAFHTRSDTRCQHLQLTCCGDALTTRPRGRRCSESKKIVSALVCGA